MVDSLNFRIEFYKIRSHISMSDKLAIEEKHEAIEKSIFIIQSLVFFTTSVERIEIDMVDYSIHLKNIEEVINNFCSVVLVENDELKKVLDGIVKQIPKV